MNKQFNVIACMNANFAIGNEGKLLYHIKEDMQNFKRMTSNQVVIMGKTTFLSLPNQKPLPNRINIVLTTSYNSDWAKELSNKYDNLFFAPSIEVVQKICEDKFLEKEWFVIGGAKVYDEFFSLDLVDKIYLTFVNDTAEGDAYFPKIFTDEWELFFKSVNENGNYEYQFYRKSNFFVK